jgi:hypothetical protein
MVFDKMVSLANVKRHDYLPFGEELVVAQGARSAALGYTGDLDPFRPKWRVGWWVHLAKGNYDPAGRVARAIA